MTDAEIVRAAARGLIVGTLTLAVCGGLSALWAGWWADRHLR